MASSTPLGPINSSRGAAEAAAGRIYFSTPSAEVRVPVGTHLPPPSTYAHTILLGGKIIRERQRKGAVGVRQAGGVKIVRRRKN